MTQKISLRAHYLHLRSALPPYRQEEGGKGLAQAISKRATGLILSFVSFRSEIDTGLLNHALAKAGQLVLPRREGNALQFYRVKNLETGLSTTSFGLQEPLPLASQLVTLEDIEISLIPALAFDENGYRLGYGTGSYDRVLKPEQKTVGIGYLEQLHPTLLPKDPWDIPVSELLLF